MDHKEELRRRFAPPTGGSVSKGKRRQLILRVNESLFNDIRLLTTALGQDRNEVCTQILSKAVAELLAVQKAKFDDAAWEIVKHCACGEQETD